MLMLLALPLLNFLLLAFLVFHYATAAPYWDQWEFVSFLDKAYGHQLTFHDLWAQHNEHRILFPRLIMLACARLSGWNIDGNWRSICCLVWAFSRSAFIRFAPRPGSFTMLRFCACCLSSG